MDFFLRVAHPHALLSLNHFKELSGTPILFASLDSVDAVFAKLKTFLPTENGLSVTEVGQLDRIHAWIKKRDAAKKEKTPEPNLGELGVTWKPLLGKGRIEAAHAPFCQESRTFPLGP